MCSIATPVAGAKVMVAKSHSIHRGVKAAHPATSDSTRLCRKRLSLFQPSLLPREGTLRVVVGLRLNEGVRPLVCAGGLLSQTTGARETRNDEEDAVLVTRFLMIDRLYRALIDHLDAKACSASRGDFNSTAPILR